MLADAAWFLYEHRWLFAWIGAQIAGAGIAGIYITGRDLVMGPDPVFEPLDEPADTAIRTSSEPEPNYHRADADTYVIPRIPGALPPETVAVERFVEAVDDATEVLAEMTGIPRHLLAQPGVSAWETFEQIEGLRVIPTSGPACPTCGGPFGACACVSQKNAPTEVTQVVDLCPLTTQDIPVVEVAPFFHETFARHPNAELGTQELSGSLARAKERAA